jgi:hypothetical protein
MNPTFGTPFNSRQGPYKQPLVDIYFIGTELLNHQLGEDGKPTGEMISPPISADGHGTFVMPEVGGKLTVPQNVADILIRKTRTVHRPGTPLAGQTAEGMTYDAKYAEVIANAHKAGKSIPEVVAEQTIAHLPDEFLEQEIARRAEAKQKLAAKEARAAKAAEKAADKKED